MDCETAVSPISAAPEASSPPTSTAAAKQSAPTAITSMDVSSGWLQPYVTSPKGLTSLLKQLKRNEKADLLQVFSTTFRAVYVKVSDEAPANESPAFLHPDEVDFYKCYLQWNQMCDQQDVSPGEITFAKEVVEAKMQRIFKEIYYLGQVEMPSLVFCGCVDVNAMLEGNEFHGYNERDLSIREARDLKAKIQKKYEGVGQESIFLMTKKPIEQLVSQMVEGFQPSSGAWTVADKRQLLQQFAAKHFDSHLDVEQVMIPCCGE